MSVVGCADGGVVVPSAEYACAEGETLPCDGNPNGPKYICVNGQWDDSLCPGSMPMGGTSN